MVFCFFIIISNNFMEEKCVCSVQIWKEVFDHFDRQPKKIETNENYSIDEDAKEILQEKCWLQKQNEWQCIKIRWM